MSRRTNVPSEIETEVLVASRRRCCLCVFLHKDDTVHKGQIAHLNRNAADSRFRNLVWLCFNHHDEYDGRTSQAKGLTEREVKTYRDRLCAHHEANKLSEVCEATTAETDMDEQELIESQYAELRRQHSDQMDRIQTPWRYPLWQVANRPEYFAYKAGNGCDGVCLIERINLPDGRIVIAAIQMAGNPGNSISNCAEELCFQVCERFAIPAEQLVWLEHYDYYPKEWTWVTFAKMPPRCPFAEPTWTVMDPKLWESLRLRPRTRLEADGSEFESKLEKLFDWPYEAI